MLKTILLPAFAALALAAPAAAQQPLDLPARSLCGSMTAQADVLCADFSPLVGIGGSVNLPTRQMQLFVKAHQDAVAFLLSYRICDQRGAVIRERKDVALAQAPVGDYVSYFQITPAANEFVCAIELVPLRTAR
jgi:hypothetical protein